MLPGLSPVDGLDIHARFDGGALSSDGGVLLLREIERKLGISDVLASCITDHRDPARTRHSHASMIRARVMAIACGYEDCDDLDALRHDPAMKMACERAPDAALGLASQPTLSRLENTPSWRALARMGLKMIDLFCGSFSTVPRQITLDIKPAPGLTRGHHGSHPWRPAALAVQHPCGRALLPADPYLRGGHRQTGRLPAPPRKAPVRCRGREGSAPRHPADTRQLASGGHHRAW